MVSQESSQDKERNLKTALQISFERIEKETSSKLNKLKSNQIHLNLSINNYLNSN